MVYYRESPETRPWTDGSHQRSWSCKPPPNRQHRWAQPCAAVLLEDMKHQSLKAVYFWNALNWLIGEKNIRVRGISSSSAVLWWEIPSETDIWWTFAENIVITEFRGQPGETVTLTAFFWEGKFWRARRGAPLMSQRLETPRIQQQPCHCLRKANISRLNYAE